MSNTGVHTFDHTVQVTNEWLHQLMERLGGQDRDAAYRQLRAVLHALRDRLSPIQAAGLASQLPLLVRGIFFEGWHPQDKPLKIRHKSDFVEHVARELKGDPANAERVTHAVLGVLSRHVSAGEMQHLKHVMPAELRSMFPEEFHTLWF